MSFFDRITGNKTNKDELSKEEAKLVDASFSAKSFFKLAVNKIGSISKINLIMLLMVSPLIFTLFGIAGSFFGNQIADTAKTPVSPLFSHFYGIAAYEDNCVFTVTALPHSLISTVNIDNVFTTILKCIGLVVVFTFGPLNVGCAYVMRNMIKEQPVFVWHDFFYAIKKNLRQSLVFGIIDILCIFAIAYALPFYYYNATTFAMQMLLFSMILITIFYVIMRVYIYLMIVTFDLSIPKLFKNAFILSSAGIKRSIVMLLGIVAVIIASAYLFILIRGLGTLLPCVFTVAFIMYLCYYCAYPVVKKYMIDPFYDEEGNPIAAPNSNS